MQLLTWPFFSLNFLYRSHLFCFSNGVWTHGSAQISSGEKESSLVAGEVGTLAYTLPFTGRRAEPFITETFRFWPDSCNKKDVKSFHIRALSW
jgi:hypothetical protein